MPQIARIQRIFFYKWTLGRFELMTSRPLSGTETGRLLLERIAAALDLPVGMFLDVKPEGEPTEQAGSTLAEQLLVLADLFKRIDDPKVRGECLDFVRKRVER